MKSFSAQIKIIGINPYVFLPVTVLKKLFQESGKSKGPIPVKGKLNGKPYTQTLVKYQGAWRLYLNGPMRIAAGIDVGDMAQVQIEYDPASREVLMHPGLSKALAKNPKAKLAFEKLAPYRKKEILRYLHRLKSPELLKRNTEKVIQYLLGKKVTGLVAVTYKR